MLVSEATDLFYATLPLAKVGVLVAGLALALPDFSAGGVLRSHIRPVLPLGLLFVLAWFWLCFVSVYVPKPYLDEVFHIPQAQKYCDGKWFEWDDKITTPPGLYGLSVLVLCTSVLPLNVACSVFNLRSVNVWCATLVAFTAGLCRCQIESNQAKPQGQSRTKPVSMYPVHTGFNIALFPVLFFFSALYYTDVMSTLAVLVAYSNHLDRVSRRRSSAISDVRTLALGILALFIRQTNVFWVVVYMGGLEAVHAAKTVAANLPKHRIADSVKTAAWHYVFNSSLGDVHDPPVSQVWPDDLPFTIVSVFVAVICNPLRVFKQVWPHLAILSAFAGFVAWNGGVVLGDKSNHVATIHLAQMLYIWPLFAFFSAPLLLPAAFSVLQGAFSLVRRPFSRTGRKGYPISHATGALGSEEPVFKRKKHNHVDFARSEEVKHSFGAPSQYQVANAPLWRLLILLVIPPFAAGVAFAVVKYNTIIHPFTLADNRHYMFYVFRHTIRQPGLFRFYLVVPYLFSANLVLGALTLGDRTRSAAATSFFNHPFLQPPVAERTQPSSPGPSGGKDKTAVPNQCRESAEAGGAASVNVLYLMKSRFDEVPSTSWTAPLTTTLVFTLATALSLVTAPLVEPRYFIIPWIMWRLHVPAWSTNNLPPTLWRIPIVRQVLFLGRIVDLRLLLETIWFFAINYLTMRVFITRPYQWVAEDGAPMDEGRLQRFMW